MPGSTEPYRRQLVHFEPILLREARAAGAARRVETSGGGVHVSKVETDRTTPLEHVHDPAHPHADAEGMVAYPNVNVTMEMADLITAVRAYEANLSVQEGFLQMAQRALRLAD